MCPPLGQGATKSRVQAAFSGRGFGGMEEFGNFLPLVDGIRDAGALPGRP